MRIYSKFYDYYDNCQGYGFDPKLVYERTTKEITSYPVSKYTKIFDQLGHILRSMPKIRNPDSKRYGHYLHDINFDTGLVGFCGKIYPYYVYDETYCYSIDSLLRSMLKKIEEKSVHYDFRHLQKIHNDIINQGKIKKWPRYSLNKKTWKKFNEDNNLDIGPDIFRLLDTPVFIFENKIICDPNLTNYNFVSQIDPYTTYQEVSMFLGNYLTTQKDPNPLVPDKIKAESKGFDKWSFRKKSKQ